MFKFVIMVEIHELNSQNLKKMSQFETKLVPKEIQNFNDIFKKTYFLFNDVYACQCVYAHMCVNVCGREYM